MVGADEIVERVRLAVNDRQESPATLAEWRVTFRPRGDTFLSALDAGCQAGQLAFCFAGGYQAALRRLLPFLAPTAFAALLLSEGKRQRPEELLTTLTPLADGRFRLDGEKSYVTGADAADPLLVIARNGVAADGRVTAALVVLPAGLPGISGSARQDVGFLAALPHGRARFDGVVVEPAMLVAGDGWRQYARPFRTLEDVHVSAAVAAHLAVHALRGGFPPALVATLLACLARLADCAAREADDPVGHLLLAGAERDLALASTEIDAAVARTDDAFARDWRANRLLLGLAAPARLKRLEKAVGRLRAANA